MFACAKSSGSLETGQCATAVGAVRGIDPTTGQYFDDTKRYVDALDISDAERAAIFEGNARRVFPRLDAKLKERGL